MADFSYSDINEAKRRVQEMKSRAKEQLPSADNGVPSIISSVPSGREKALLLSLYYLVSSDNISEALISAVINILFN